MKIKVQHLLHVKDGRLLEPTNDTELYLCVTLNSRRNKSFILYNLRTREAWFADESVMLFESIHGPASLAKQPSIFKKQFRIDEGTKQLLDHAFELYVAGHEDKMRRVGNHTVSIKS